MINSIDIIQPDDWHVHLREKDMMKLVTKYSSRVNRRCIAMPNTNIPITKSIEAKYYRAEIKKYSQSNNFAPLIPCYLTENLNLSDFKSGLNENLFVGAKLYPTNATTNSSMGVSNIEKIFPALEILEQEGKVLLVHGEKIRDDIDIFEREKYFIDEEFSSIRKKFKDLKIVLEHVSSAYGVDYVNSNDNIAGTITPHHMLLTKNDVFINDSINPHHFCMPVVKNEVDLISLRKAACKNNKKFFLGTDSAPHHIDQKTSLKTAKPGIFSAASSIELYATIFEEENSLNNLEYFSSINGPKFYNLPINIENITLFKEEWIIPDFVEYNNIRVKNFFGGKKINWKVKELKV